ncbi:hypothetical protein H0H92_013183, partial [Tricholoma furcatifolium]
MSTDQCALDSNGKLKDARDIVWYNDPDDELPVSRISVDTANTESSAAGRSGLRIHNSSRMSMVTAADKLDDEGNLKRKFRASGPARARRVIKKAKTGTQHEDADDDDDEDYEVEDGVETESDDEDVHISNEE